MVNGNSERDRFIDSSFDQGDSLLNRSNPAEQSTRFSELEKISPSLGQRVVPGQGGFRLADTPQAWVFIQKKEWLDDTWTYVINDPEITISSGGQSKKVKLSALSSDLEVAQADLTKIRQRLSLDLPSDRRNQLTIEEQSKQKQIQQLQGDISAAEQTMAQSGSFSQIPGKVTQIDIRSALANIITRKLDLVAEHEKFTKVTAAHNQSVEAIQLKRQGEAIKAVQDSYQSIDKEIAEIDRSIQTLKISNISLEKQQQQSQLVINQATQKIQELTVQKAALITQLETAHGNLPPALAQSIQERIDLINTIIAELQSQIEQVSSDLTRIVNQIATNLQRIQELEKRRAETVAKAQNPSLDSYNTDTVQLYTPTTFSGNAYTRYYKSPVVKNVSNAQARQLRAQLEQTLVQLTEQSNNLIQQTRTGRTGAQEQLLQTQLEYADTRRQLDTLNTRLAAQQLDAPVAVEVGKETFNGVMELANVSQVTTSINIEGEGSANFTIENPQNLFFISQDDVDLALSEDPFLESTRTLGGMVYYRGRFYPPQIVDMLLRRKGYTTGLLNTKEALATQIASQISDLTQQIHAIDAELAASAALMNTSDVQQFASKKASLQADLTELQKQQDNLNKSLFASTQQQTDQDKTSSSQETRKKQDNMSLIRQTLVKYYVSKTILQVLDRVYIWMTSPTRTIFRLNRQGPDRFGLEDPSAVIMGRQLPEAQAWLELLQSEKERLIAFFQTNATDAEGVGIPATNNPAVVVNLQPLPGYETQLFTVNPSLVSLAEGGSELTFEQVKTYNNEIYNEINLAEATIEVLRKQTTSTDALTGARTLDKLPFSRGLGRDSQQQRQIINNYESRYQGIEEERLQVFQGVISTVKQTYSDGKYQIHVSCRDNLVFLSMSRIMIKPALRADQGPRGLLQDPIWRGNELAGNWKNGIVVLDFAFVNDEVRARMDRNITIDANVQPNLIKRKVLSEKEAKEGGVTPFVTSLPFAKIDAADLVSFVITGFPYNFELFLKNAAFGGRTTFQRTDGTTDQRDDKTSYFAFLKRRIGELNDRLGDFEPFIDLGGDQFNPAVFKRRKDQLTNAQGMALSDLDTTYKAYITNKMQQLLLRVQEAKKGLSLVVGAGLNIIEQTLQPLLSQEVLKQQSAIAQYYIDTKQFTLKVDNGTSFILQKLVEVVINAAKSNSSFQAGPNQASTAVGTQLGTESDFERIAGLLANKSSAQIGAFQVIANIAIAEANSVKKSTKTGGVRTGSSQATGPGVPDSNLETVETIARDALRPFVRALLLIQAGFSQEYVNASVASTNLASLNHIEPALYEYLNDIKSQSASIQADIKDGPQSTLEKIVRAEKKNFLIISDQYELDFDLQAYQTQIGQDFALWQSEWETPLSICRRAAEQVDFEFYADENGNIQFKPPTYNRILKEHFPLISETDRNVRNAILIRYGGTYGQVLRTVLKAVALLNQTKVEFDSKRLLAVNALNLSKASQKRQGNIPTQGDVAGGSTNSTTQSLQYARSEEITAVYQALVGQTVQQIKDGSTICDRNAWVPITASLQAEQEAQKNIRLLRITEDRGLTSIDTDAALQQDDEKIFLLGQDKDKANSQLQRLNNELESAEEADKQTPPQPHRPIATIQNDIVNTNATLAEIQSQINSRSFNTDQRKLQSRVKLYTTLDGQIDSLLSQANDTRERVRQQAQSFVDGLERFTDECRIHRIADYDIIGYELTEAPPRFTYLEVTGAPELVQITPAEYYWAGGVDYDNWRQYGYISENMQKAYFHSGDQARTYIRAMLGRERGRIFTASMSVRGDSKFRVGDCIFVECLGMYFYILSVSQSLTYAGSYITNLALSYGRRIGEIIPHPFDALGKIMIETYQTDLEEALARQQFAKQQQGKSNKQT